MENLSLLLWYFLYLIKYVKYMLHICIILTFSLCFIAGFHDKARLPIVLRISHVREDRSLMFLYSTPMAVLYCTVQCTV